jgi:hypothetical protein
MAPERKVLPLRRFQMTWQEMLSVQQLFLVDTDRTKQLREWQIHLV